MSNDYVAAYLEKLDAVYKAGSVTSILDADPSMYRIDETDAKTVYTRRIAFGEGLATYDRDNGYDDTTAEAKWEAHLFAYDRGKMIDFDALDEIEAKQAAVEIAAEYYKDYLIPETDAIRFKKMYDIKTASDATADLDEDTVAAAIDTAVEAMDDNEVAQFDRFLFISNNTYNNLKNSGEIFNSRIVSEYNPVINRNILMYDDMPIIKVPKSRFSTAPTISATDGFAAAGYYLNFAIVQKQAVLAIIKHNKPKLILPEFHQTKDAYRAAVRISHDLFIPVNKKNGIYLHKKTTGI
jgi:hypothetical protein